MRIGILAEGFAEWQGGIDFLRTICDSLRLGFAGEEPDLRLVYPRQATLAAVDQLTSPWRRWLREGRATPWRGLLGRQLRESSFARLARLREAVGALPALRFRDDEDLDGVARRERLDCLLPSFRPLAKDVRTPWLGYLYDFQHRYLPHLFSPEERQQRDARFALMARRARHVIVNSRAVADDCRRFLGDDGAKFVALPFGAAPMPEWLAERPDLCTKYVLPKRYFLVSNQFWMHKNHRLVFAALQQLGRTHLAGEAHVVCTGSTVDARDAGYFPTLQRFLDENGLATNVRILGHIPKRDQIEIMKGALAVIQPTLFEGGPGGGAIYDAVSLGVPALVSDIAVNRELEGSGFAIEFFDPHDSAALAGLMHAHLFGPPVARRGAATLISAGRERRRAVGRVLAQTIRAAMSGAA